MAAPTAQTSTPRWRVVSSADAWPSSTIRWMNASSEGSTCQSRVSAHQSAWSWGCAESTVSWKSYAIGSG